MEHGRLAPNPAPGRIARVRCLPLPGQIREVKQGTPLSSPGIAGSAKSNDESQLRCPRSVHGPSSQARAASGHQVWIGTEQEWVSYLRRRASSKRDKLSITVSGSIGDWMKPRCR